MLNTKEFPSHVHLVPPEDGLLLFRGLDVLNDYANKLYNEGLGNGDNAMMDMAATLILQINLCRHRQFDAYSVEHLSQNVIAIKSKSP
jgi:hypothetical protein